MRILTTLATLAAAATFLAAQNQATPAPKTQQAPSAKTQPTGATKAPAEKTGAATSKPGATSLTTQKQKVSYALGMNLGMNFSKQGVDLDPDALALGMKAAISGGKTLLTEDEMRATLMQAQTELQKKQAEKRQSEGAANKRDGDAFLAANKSKEGVVTLPSGLEYKILKEGTGPKPKADDSVVCNYRGTLISGQEFDSSYKRGQPATFPVNGVIKGWTEALQMMPVGSKWQLFIPPTLAYGEQGAPGGTIGPNATLIFEVELLSIQEKPKTQEAPKAEEEPKADEKPQNPPM